MTKKQTVDLDAAFREGNLIDEALIEASRHAVKIHRQANLPLAVWRDGSVHWISPDELTLPPEAPGKGNPE